MSQNNQNNLTAQFQQQHVEIKSGPLPDPAILAQYDKALPGTAQKIVDVFTKQVDHRIQVEREQMELKRRQMAVIEQYVSIDSRNSLLGIIMAAILGLSVVGLGAYAIHIGYAVAGSLVSSIGIGSIIGAFIYGTSVNRKREENK